MFDREIALKAYEEFLNLYCEYKKHTYHISEKEWVLIVEDSVVFYIMMAPNHEFKFAYGLPSPENDGSYGLHIEELTSNNLLPNFKHTVFIEDTCDKLNTSSFSFMYSKFKWSGNTYLSNALFSHEKYIIEKLPEVQLRERLDAWPGVEYAIVVFEMTGANGDVAYAVDAIKSNVHSYVLKIAKNFLDGKSFIYEHGTIGLSQHGKVDKDFTKLYRSHKKGRIAKRLEENLKYFSLDRKFFKKENDLYEAVDSVLADVKSGKLNFIERIEYKKPEYRWKSEELVYKLVKKKYKQHGVIYQHRPFFLLSSSGHQLSYDVYISELKVAIEYQGKQHFEPVAYFGGEEAFIRQKKRDEEKAFLSQKNGVKLVYINYWEDITPELIAERVES